MIKNKLRRPRRTALIMLFRYWIDMRFWLERARRGNYIWLANSATQARATGRLGSVCPGMVAQPALATKSLR